MNKLELEMHENLLKFQIELVEDMVKTCKSCIRLDWSLFVIGAFAVGITTCLTVKYARCGNWFLAIFELFLALFNVYLYVKGVYRHHKNKVRLKWAKCELEKINSEIELLHK